MDKLPILANNAYMQKARSFLSLVSKERELMSLRSELDQVRKDNKKELAQERKERQQEREAMKEIISALASGNIPNFKIEDL